MQIEATEHKKCLLHVSELKAGEVYTNVDYENPYIATPHHIVNLKTGGYTSHADCVETGWVHQPQAKVVL